MTDELAKEIDEILVDSVGMDFCENKACSHYEQYLLTKQAIQALIAKECNRARIDEIKRYREAMTFAHITPSIYAAERIPELISEDNNE